MSVATFLFLSPMLLSLMSVGLVIIVNGLTPKPSSSWRPSQRHLALQYRVGTVLTPEVARALRYLSNADARR